MASVCAIVDWYPCVVVVVHWLLFCWPCHGGFSREGRALIFHELFRRCAVAVHNVMISFLICVCVYELCVCLCVRVYVCVCMCVCVCKLVCEFRTLSASITTASGGSSNMNPSEPTLGHCVFVKIKHTLNYVENRKGHNGGCRENPR